MFEAAFISYAVFLALALLFVVVVVTIIGVKALIDLARRHHTHTDASTDQTRNEPPNPRFPP